MEHDFMIYLITFVTIGFYFVDCLSIIRITITEIPVLLLFRTRVRQFHVEKKSCLRKVWTEFFDNSFKGGIKTFQKGSCPPTEYEYCFRHVTLYRVHFFSPSSSTQNSRRM